MLLQANAQAWELWQKVQTQWRVGLTLIGLDYTAVISVATIFGTSITPELLEKIQTLEYDTLNSIAEKSDG